MGGTSFIMKYKRQSSILFNKFNPLSNEKHLKQDIRNIFRQAAKLFHFNPNLYSYVAHVN